MWTDDVKLDERKARLRLGCTVSCPENGNLEILITGPTRDPLVAETFSSISCLVWGALNVVQPPIFHQDNRQERDTRRVGNLPDSTGKDIIYRAYFGKPRAEDAPRRLFEARHRVFSRRGSRFRARRATVSRPPGIR